MVKFTRSDEHNLGYQLFSIDLTLFIAYMTGTNNVEADLKTGWTRRGKFYTEIKLSHLSAWIVIDPGKLRIGLPYTCKKVASFLSDEFGVVQRNDHPGMIILEIPNTEPNSFRR